jgi:hypothetical protein
MFFVQELYLTEIMPEFIKCSYELSLSGIINYPVCDGNATVLHCYAAIPDISEVACEWFYIIGHYNFI